MLLICTQVEDSTITADLVDVGCDAEVAELTCRDREIQVHRHGIRNALTLNSRLLPST